MHDKAIDKLQEIRIYHRKSGHSNIILEIMMDDLRIILEEVYKMSKTNKTWKKLQKKALMERDVLKTEELRLKIQLFKREQQLN